MVKITPRQIFTTWWKSSSLYQNFPLPHWEGRFRHYPSNAIWKTLTCLTFQSRGVEIISAHFSVWLWTVTQFHTSENEMSLMVLLVIGNGFLIPTWKYWIWISKKVFSGHINVREWPKYTLTSKQFWKLTKNEQKWCNFKMYVTGCLLIIKY